MSRRRAVVAAAAQILVHVPSLVRFGSKPSRELVRDPALLPLIESCLRPYQAVRDYLPHQVFIGGRPIKELSVAARPWGSVEGGSRFGPFGEVMPEEEFWGLLKLADTGNLVTISEGLAERARAALGAHPTASFWNLERLSGVSEGDLLHRQQVNGSLSVMDKLVAVSTDAREDTDLRPEVLLENLAAKATGALALAHLLIMGNAERPQIGLVIGCGEEAVGDRYQRGGGGMGKATAEMVGLEAAAGLDVKAFCCAPVHSLAIAGALVSAGLHDHVIVVGGGSLAKLGMKFMGHLKNNIPVMEDVLAGFAILVTRDGGSKPVLRLDSVGQHCIRTGSNPVAIMDSLVAQPLANVGLRILDVDRIATELHNPDITEPSGSGNVPHNNYRTIGALAVTRGELAIGDIEQFVVDHGMPGFSPTQGHIASAIPYMPHALRDLQSGAIKRALFVAKGSLFLGRMTGMSDGASIVLESDSP
jgi:hypothetical protein